MIDQALPVATVATLPPADTTPMIDQHLRQLLHDVQVLVPCEVAAAWLGHDDHPSLRIVVPEQTDLPSLKVARHVIFETTSEAARIDDLHTYSGLRQTNLRAWLGVPPILHGQRRGWIELLSAQPARFKDRDVQCAETLVRQSMIGLMYLETATGMQHALESEQRIMHGLEQASCAPSLDATLATLLAHVAHDPRVVAAKLLLPAELAYALGIHDEQAQMPDPQPQANPELDNELVKVVAQWPSADGDGSALANDEPTHQVLLPCVQAGETLAWIALETAGVAPLSVAISGELQRVSGLVAALLIWLREQSQREQHAQQSIRVLVQQAHGARAGAITELMAGLAHELNNPVSALSGLAQLLQRDPSIPPALSDDIGAIVSETGRISELVKRLSSFSQSAGSTKVPLKLNEVVSETVDVLRGVAQQRNVTLVCEMPDESPLVLGNRAQLQQVCLDLLSNAFDAVEASDAPQVRVQVVQDGAWAEVRISDNGYGIPEDLRDRIFTPGFTTKTTGGTRRGLGIGLPMAANILRSHWGSISVTSQIWEGGCFTLRLPII